MADDILSAKYFGPKGSASPKSEIPPEIAEMIKRYQERTKGMPPAPLERPKQSGKKESTIQFQDALDQLTPGECTWPQPSPYIKIRQGCSI